MLQAFINSRQKQRIAWMMLLILVSEFTLPTLSYALSSGPVQPEISSFEPVGTTDMVDLFTGDFVYNIPLMDVEGYPVNIAYHGGVTMEQEASWVGLGWNISPGAVNRGVRGLPDDFAGDTVEKELNVKPEITKKIGLIGNAEFFGVGDPLPRLDVNLGGYVTMSNYRGVSVDFTASSGINTQFNIGSAGLNFGVSVGSQAGAAINYGSSVSLGVSQAVGKDLNAGGSFNLNSDGVYSPRTGARKNVGWNVGVSASHSSMRSPLRMSTGTNVAIGLQNHTAAITNSSYMNSYSGQLRVGLEMFGGYGYARVAGSVTTMGYNSDGSRPGYGYFNLDKAGERDLVDFSREKDGNFNTTMHLLPQSHLTYDVYSVTGQGTGGSFRPIRNDFGSIYDPLTTSKNETNSFMVEGGFGNLFEVGGEYVNTKTTFESGPWSDYKRPFVGKAAGVYEDVYFKEAGELTENNDSYLNGIGNDQVLTPGQVGNLGLVKPGAGRRTPRANFIYATSGAAMDSFALLDQKKITSFNDTNGFAAYPTVAKTTIDRVDATAKRLKRKPHQLNQIVQTQKDGRRYVYGLPVMNNVQREATFAIDKNYEIDHEKYLVPYVQGVDDSKSNTNGLDYFYSSTVTPSYVAAHLLTSVLSKDYVDVTGDGVSDDDLGTYTKFNYSRKSADYRWRTPMDSGYAQYIPGYFSDKNDDKATCLSGSREQWLLHSIETRNYVAEFYVSPRQDAKGAKDRIFATGSNSIYNEAPYNQSALEKDNLSYKLDSIVLYNKHDRFANNVQAVPIKTVFFSYSYDLCRETPNSAEALGKLTLTGIRMKFGTSNLNMGAGYSFVYDNDHNYKYNTSEKDRWGNYKQRHQSKNNFEFPFTEQSGNTNDFAKAWSLSEIRLPSGGVIKVDYESDDYGYVQDKQAMQMFHLKGLGAFPKYMPWPQLYFNSSVPNLYLYFERDLALENSNLSFKENYLKDSVMYFNIPVEMARGAFEPVKGYAVVDSMGKCSDGIHGFVRLSPRTLDGTNTKVNPVLFTALNLGRYNLPHIFFPGSDLESPDLQKVIDGLQFAVKELFGMHKNPLSTMISERKGQNVDLAKGFIRLLSPGLQKKGGGQRVKSIRFYDNWQSMAGGNEAIYGKTYDYTMQREDGRGVISSGVASYEPLIGGDEIPHRMPVYYRVQDGTKFPPNDAIDLYQEWPIGESFFPAPVVGYSKVTVRSINIDKGRSSQNEDIHGFYTAKDFPIRTVNSPISSPKRDRRFTLKDMTLEQTSTQGFSIVLNDMHGKPRNTEHWVLKPAGGAGARELVNYQKYEYKTNGGMLSNEVPVFEYNGNAAQLSVVNRKLGLETDISLDTRINKEQSKMIQLSTNTNSFLLLFWMITAVSGYPFFFENNSIFRSATVTKVTQQYGILDKVISNNQGAITELRNEVFDQQTGNALVTSVNNEFGDREYTVNYPAHWAYKEFGPAYENHNIVDTFRSAVRIDSFGAYSRRFINYNNSHSKRYDLPSNMPVALAPVDELMPRFKLGDELLINNNPGTDFEKVWVMGYTSDINHCYAVLASRNPYTRSPFWQFPQTYAKVSYRVLKSGNQNRLGETIQTYTTKDRSNIFPYLKDDLNDVLSLSATQYNHKLGAVYAANTTSDSLNPFVTGKVGHHRAEMELFNLKNRDYKGATARDAGLYATPAYWKTERDNYDSYCSNDCEHIMDDLRLEYLDGDSMRMTFTPSATQCQGRQLFKFLWGQNTHVTPGWQLPPNGPMVDTISFDPGVGGSFVIHNRAFLEYRYLDNGYGSLVFLYTNGCCNAKYTADYSQDPNRYFTYDDLQLARDYNYSNSNISQLSFNNPVTLSQGTALFDNHTYQNPVYFDTTLLPLSPWGRTYGRAVNHKILLGKVGHWSNPLTDNWVKAQKTTKYNWFGEELENHVPGVGYNSAVYGYNQQLPVTVSQNARHGEVLHEGFEEYALLQPKPSRFETYMPLFFSPFAPLVQTVNLLGLQYKQSTLTGSNFSITKEQAHSGTYSMKVPSTDAFINLNPLVNGMSEDYSFRMKPSRKYVVSVWLRPMSINNFYANTGYGWTNIWIESDTAQTGTPTHVALQFPFAAKSNIIDGWQQYETIVDAPAGFRFFTLKLSSGYYYDDIRVFPYESNSKGFVYHPVTRKLMATLDENNFATFYEYDAEGNLIRTKKETEKGIMTVSESRNAHSKSN